MEAKLSALEGRHAHMESRMQDAFARATRASEEAEGIRAKLRAEHANVLRLTKQLETVRQGPPGGKSEGVFASLCACPYQ